MTALLFDRKKNILVCYDPNLDPDFPFTVWDQLPCPIDRPDRVLFLPLAWNSVKEAAGPILPHTLICPCEKNEPNGQVKNVSSKGVLGYIDSNNVGVTAKHILFPTKNGISQPNQAPTSCIGPKKVPAPLIDKADDTGDLALVRAVGVVNDTDWVPAALVHEYFNDVNIVPKGPLYLLGRRITSWKTALSKMQAYTVERRHDDVLRVKNRRYPIPDGTWFYGQLKISLIKGTEASNATEAIAQPVLKPLDDEIFPEGTTVEVECKILRDCHFVVAQASASEEGDSGSPLVVMGKDGPLVLGFWWGDVFHTATNGLKLKAFSGMNQIQSTVQVAGQGWIPVTHIPSTLELLVGGWLTRIHEGLAFLS
jgi:hypothetical protein